MPLCTMASWSRGSLFSPNPSLRKPCHSKCGRYWMPRRLTPRAHDKLRYMDLWKLGATAMLPIALFAAGMPDDKELVDWVEKRVRELQPSRAERRFDEVGW